MNAERWREVELVLDRALDSDPADWQAVVAEACGTDEALRREVERLLAEYSREPGILAATAGAVAGAVAAEVVRERALESDRA